MKTVFLALASALLFAATAQAEPVKLDDKALDNVAAGISFRDVRTPRTWTPPALTTRTPRAFTPPNVTTREMRPVNY